MFALIHVRETAQKLVLAARAFAVPACVQTTHDAPKPLTPAGLVTMSNSEPGPATLAAKHEPPASTQAVIVIPDDWRQRFPYSERFPQLQSAAEVPSHVIDLAAMRFETENLVSLAPGGQRQHTPPNVSTFARELDRPPFVNGSEDYFIVQANTALDQIALRTFLESNKIPIFASQRPGHE